MVGKLGEGGFGLVHKGYDKINNEFVAIKMLKDPGKSKEILEQIILEDGLLRRVEEIRSSQDNFRQYFLKYDGIFKNPKDGNALILRMESGIATLDNILEAGKNYSCDELLYIISKLVHGFSILQTNGIANRDVKAQNIILVEEKSEEGGFSYKISDFGIGCLLPKGQSFINSGTVTGITNAYAAPEVIRLCDEAKNEEYDPFLADVYSLGLVFLKMINRKWGKTGLGRGLLGKNHKFKGFEEILPILEGMMEEDISKRWNFQKVLDFYQSNEENFAKLIKRPKNEDHFCHLWQVEFKEKIAEETKEGLEKLFMEHLDLFWAYDGNVTRPTEAKFHLDRDWHMNEKLKTMHNCTIDDFMQYGREMCFLIAYCHWEIEMQNLDNSEEFIEEALHLCKYWSLKNKENSEMMNPDEQFIKKGVINEFKGDIINLLGRLYENKGELERAEECYMKSLKIYEKLFGDNHFRISTL